MLVHGFSASFLHCDLSWHVPLPSLLMDDLPECLQRHAYLSYLDIWEFFSLLVNTEEIHDEKILDYYMDSLKINLGQIFNDYPDLRDKKEKYKEIKKLLKKWDPNYYSWYFESKSGQDTKRIRFADS
jgi:hypothetical protein